MATIRNRLGKINMFTQGRDLGIPKYLAEKGLDVNVEYVRNGIDDGMLAIEVFETKEVEKEKEHDRLDKSKKEDTKEPKTAMDIMEEVKQKIMTDEEKRMVEFNNYIDDLNIDGLIKFMNGESDNFEPIPIPKEVDDDNRR